MSPSDKPLVWLHGDVKSPPFSDAARREAGFLLRMLQRGELRQEAAGAIPKGAPHHGLST